MYDVLIVGAGISGCFIARDLSRYQLSVAVVEKANDVANGATMANSAIVHSGHDPKPGTLKAKLNVEGNRMYEDICKELHVDFQRVGAYVVASCEEQLPHLEELYNQAKERNVPVEYVEKEDLFKNEPNITIGLFINNGMKLRNLLFIDFPFDSNVSFIFCSYVSSNLIISR